MESRIRPPCTLLAAAFLLLLTGAARAQFSDNLYKVFPSRVRTAVKASSDPVDLLTAPWQGNDDGFTGVNGCESYRYLDNGTPVSVLAHFEGRAGVLGLFFRNFWSDYGNVPMLPLENNRTRVWVDGATAFDMPLWNYFRSPGTLPAQVAPFDGPFTRRRSGGHLTHAQLQWNDRFVIGLDDDSFHNAARFHRVAATLASPEGALPMPDMARWEQIANNPGQWPHLTPRVPKVESLIVPGQGGSVRIDIPGPAVLLEATFRVPGRFDWRDLWAQFTWDYATAPQVDIPLRHLGALVDPVDSFPVRSLLVDNNGDTRVTCWFPMPFAQHARIGIRNDGPANVKVEFTYSLLQAPPEPGWGHFVAKNRREVTGTGETFQGPVLRDSHGMLRLLMLEDSADTSGSIPDMHMTHLEGDLCLRINGNRGDDHTFAASETSIGRWGWYLNPVDLPFVSDTSFQSGPLLRVSPGGLIEYRRIMGSTYLFDPVHFVDGIDIALEHGPQNSSNADYSLTAFFYVQPDGPARRTIGEIDIGNVDPMDPNSEPAHQVRSTVWSTYTQRGNVFRDQFYGTPPITGVVRHIRDYLQFRVKRPMTGGPHHGFAIGLRLDRLGASSSGVCQADVYVDGQPAGLLHVATHNPIFPWKEGGECEVELPLALTAGKSAFDVTLRPRLSSDPLQVERVWVYEYVKP